MSITSRALSTGYMFLGILVATMGQGSSSEQDRKVQIVNSSDFTVNSFYASNTRRQSWQEDILGNSVLEPGQSIFVKINDGTGSCFFDFKAVFVNGRTVESYGMNVCKTDSWTIR